MTRDADFVRRRTLGPFSGASSRLAHLTEIKMPTGESLNRFRDRSLSGVGSSPYRLHLRAYRRLHGDDACSRGEGVRPRPGITDRPSPAAISASCVACSPACATTVHARRIAACIPAAPDTSCRAGGRRGECTGLPERDPRLGAHVRVAVRSVIQIDDLSLGQGVTSGRAISAMSSSVCRSLSASFVFGPWVPRMTHRRKRPPGLRATGRRSSAPPTNLRRR
jgi:hypothetical protein